MIMNSVVRNVFALGVALIFVVFAWVTFEIWKTSIALQQVADPALSVERGFENAEHDFSINDARFKQWKL